MRNKARDRRLRAREEHTPDRDAGAVATKRAALRAGAGPPAAALSRRAADAAANDARCAAAETTEAGKLDAQ